MISTAAQAALVIWFYLGWFGCVYFAKWDLSIYTLIFPAIPFCYFAKIKLFKSKEIKLLIGAVIMGIAFDSLMHSLGLIQFSDHNSAGIPIWLVSMWLLFISIFPLSQALFKSKLWLAGILAAVFGPLSYLSGEAFDVLLFTSLFPILIYALFWGFYFPTMIFLYRKQL